MYIVRPVRIRWRFDKAIYVLVCWAALGLTGLAIYNRSSQVHWPAPIQVYRDGKVDVYSWQSLIECVAMAAAALWIALTTKVGEKTDPVDLGYTLRRYAKTSGWIIAVGSALAAIHLLLILLGVMEP